MKKNNKGFSLVELIIVIAIMAILAGAIAPALIRYIDKSRKSNDVSSAKTIKTAVETALGNESIYEYLTTSPAGSTPTAAVITFTPGTTIKDDGTDSGVAISTTGRPTANINGKTNTELNALADKEIGNSIGEKVPKLKYQKEMVTTGTTKVKPERFYAVVSTKGTVYVFIGGTTTPTVDESDSSVGVKISNGWQISPYIADEYQ